MHACGRLYLDLCLLAPKPSCLPPSPQILPPQPAGFAGNWPMGAFACMSHRWVDGKTCTTETQTLFVFVHCAECPTWLAFAPQTILRCNQLSLACCSRVARQASQRMIATLPYQLLGHRHVNSNANANTVCICAPRRVPYMACLCPAGNFEMHLAIFGLL